MPSLLLLLLLQIETRSVVTRPVPPPAGPIAAPPIRIAPPDEAWPAVSAGKPISAPDWADYRLYPPAALELDQQGRVAVDSLVSPEGVPVACRVRSSSGYAELDVGTCNIMNLLRFAPARDAEGNPVPSVYRRSFLWLESEPTPFAAARMIVRLKLAGGKVRECILDEQGGAPPDWSKLACRKIGASLDYYLGARRADARRAIVEFEVMPTGSSLAGGATRPEPPAAEWRSEFGLAPNGDVRDCRNVVDRGFGPASENDQSPCGFFLTRAWFSPAGPEGPNTGTYRLRVYIDR